MSEPDKHQKEAALLVRAFPHQNRERVAIALRERDAEIERLKAEHLMLAKLASEHPEFDNPFRQYDAEKLRDRILDANK